MPTLPHRRGRGDTLAFAHNLNMDFSLNHEQQLIVDTVRRFVEEELYPLEADLEKTGHLPLTRGREIIAQVKELGFYAANMPAAIGGGGLNHLDFTLLERELGRTAMGLSVWWGRPSNILLACEGEQREQFLFPAVRGEKIDALAMTEPNAGSDLRSMACTAKADGGDWVINGRKHFISHADIADFIIVFAASGSETTARGARKKITVFLVEKGDVGFKVLRGYDSVSHRGYQNCILEFDDCRLPTNRILGEVHRGFDIANQWLYATRISVAAMCVGRARRAFDYALQQAASREQFGQTIGKFQGVGFKLADMITSIDAADWLTLAAAWQLDQGEQGSGSANRKIASAKLYASEMLARVTDEAIQIHGGMGLMADLPLERLWRDARVERIWDGTSEIQRHIISRELLRPLEQ